MSRCHFIVGLAILGPFCWFFGLVLAGSESFLLHETSYFYYPLFEWIAEEWRAGRIPLWNPQENCGVPVVGDTTSSVFYPGKLLLALPLSYAFNFKLYVTCHVLLAAINAFLLARHCDRSVLASGICSLSFAYGGAVFFTYTNVVFLVGASWLPLAIWAGERMLLQRRVVGALVLSAVLALMTLGGDPQTAYHTALVLVLYAWILWRSERHQRVAASAAARLSEPSVPPDANWAWPNSARHPSIMQRICRSRLCLLGLTAVTSGLLAAIQILPAARWSQQSERAAFDAPRSVYEIPTVLARSANDQPPGNEHPYPAWAVVAEGLLGQPEKLTHAQDIYEASVAPWRLVELLWPNFSGKMLPDRHHRWLDVVTGTQWATPSLYMGLLPLLLAAGVWTIRGKDVRLRWWSWTVLLAVLASFGSFGVGWLVNWLLPLTGWTDVGQPRVVGDPVGGLYWFLVTFLPGYAQFRDPAKWFVISTLGLSLLSAYGWDGLWSGSQAGLRPKLWTVVVLSVVGTFLLLALLPYWEATFDVNMADKIFGPWNRAGAWLDLYLSMLHAAILGGVLLLLIPRVPAGAQWQLQAMVLIATALEISVASGWMVPSAPDRVYQSTPRAVRELHDRGIADPSRSPFRVMRQLNATAAPNAWEFGSAAARVAELVDWRRDWFFPRFHLQTDFSLVESELSIMSQDFAAVLAVARQHQLQQRARRGQGTDEFPLPHGALLDALGARVVLLPRKDLPLARQLGFSDLGQRDVGNVLLLHNSSAYPRAWFVAELDAMRPLTDAAPRSVVDRTELIWFPDGEPRDFRREAVVETNLPLDVMLLSKSTEGPTDHICEIITYQPRRIELEVRTPRAGLLVLGDLYYPGWTAHRLPADGRTNQELPILRTNRIMRGVVLPAGNHRLVFQYWPIEFYLGGALSAVSWLTLIGLLAGAAASERRN